MRFAAVALPALVIGLVLLWMTGFCFETFRYMSKDEICDIYLSHFQGERRKYLAPDTRCRFETPAVGVFAVVPSKMSGYGGKQVLSGDVLQHFDACGRPVRVPRFSF